MTVKILTVNEAILNGERQDMKSMKLMPLIPTGTVKRGTKKANGSATVMLPDEWAGEIMAATLTGKPRCSYFICRIEPIEETK